MLVFIITKIIKTACYNIHGMNLIEEQSSLLCSNKSCSVNNINVFLFTSIAHRNCDALYCDYIFLNLYIIRMVNEKKKFQPMVIIAGSFIIFITLKRIKKNWFYKQFPYNDGHY